MSDRFPKDKDLAASILHGRARRDADEGNNVVFCYCPENVSKDLRQFGRLIPLAQNAHSTVRANHLPTHASKRAASKSGGFNNPQQNT